MTAPSGARLVVIGFLVADFVLWAARALGRAVPMYPAVSDAGVALTLGFLFAAADVFLITYLMFGWRHVDVAAACYLFARGVFALAACAVARPLSWVSFGPLGRAMLLAAGFGVLVLGGVMLRRRRTKKTR